ncbi:MAG: phytanoyl-CoA dioxygenase family protein [Chloroflexota bacterium]
MSSAAATIAAPMTTEAPLPRRKLTTAERRTYDEVGYVVVPSVFPADELEGIDGEIDRILARLAAERASRQAPQRESHHAGSGSILQLGLRSPVCQRLAEDERILTLIEDLVQPGIAIYSVKLIAKPPRTNIVCHWHQDDAYYVKQSDSQTRMSVWVPLQDAHDGNGCLWVVPGSHRWGLQDHSAKDYGQCRLSMDAERIDLSGAIPVPVPAGSAVLFSALMWHGSKGNETDKVRRAFIVSYQEATVPRGNGDQWKILRPATASTAG